MAEFRLALGGTVDVATTEEMNDAITGLQGHIDNKLAKLKSDRWTWRTIQGSGASAFSSGGSIQIPLTPDRPATGKVWSLRRITVLGNDDHSTVTSLTAALYSGDMYNVNLAQCIIPGQTMPYFQTFGNNSVPILSTDSLFVNIEATASVTYQQFVISASVQEWDDPAIEVQYA